MDFQKEQQLRSRLAGNIRRLRMSRSPCLSQKMLAGSHPEKHLTL
jgi:hypothetical protein